MNLLAIALIFSFGIVEYAAGAFARLFNLRYGNELVRASKYTFAFGACFAFVECSINWLVAMLYGGEGIQSAYEHLLSWLLARIEEATLSWQVWLGIVGRILRFVVVGGILYPLVAIINASVSGPVFFTMSAVQYAALLYTFASFVYGAAFALLALGAVLYAVPRCRYAGAMVFAFTLVLYVSLPLMPAFVDAVVGGAVVPDLVYEDIFALMRPANVTYLEPMVLIEVNETLVDREGVLLLEYRYEGFLGSGTFHLPVPIADGAQYYLPEGNYSLERVRYLKQEVPCPLLNATSPAWEAVDEFEAGWNDTIVLQPLLPTIAPIRVGNVSTFVEGTPLVHRIEWNGTDVVRIESVADWSVVRVFQPNGTSVVLDPPAEYEVLAEDEYGALIEFELVQEKYYMWFEGEPVSEEYREEALSVDVEYSEKYEEAVAALLSPTWLESVSMLFVRTVVFPSVYLVGMFVLAGRFARLIA